MDRDDVKLPVDDEVVELTLLLPRRRLALLETLAHQQGLTLGQLVRRMIQTYIADGVDASLQSVYALR